MVIFRENTEDVYAGKELEAGSEGARKLLEFLDAEFGWDIRPDSGIGIKPVSKTGSKRLIRAAIRYAVANNRRSVTLVHKGNIMKFTEGAFRQVGLRIGEGGVRRRRHLLGGLRRRTRATSCSSRTPSPMLSFSRSFSGPAEYDVIATMNLNGDYVSDALAAQVGGIGIAPGGNINYETGHAVFEATHGTAPKYAGQDKVNPGSVTLSGEMMLRYMGWTEAADLIVKGLESAIGDKVVTYDFARQMEGANEVKTSEFGTAIIERM